MSYLYLFIAMVFSALITVGSRLYNNKNQGVTNISALYCLLSALSGAIFWLVLWFTDFSFSIRVLPYSVLYGITFSCFTFGMLGAIKTGSTSLTALIKQVALVSVSFWGFLFWGTQFTILSVIGIALLVISLSLCLIVKEKKTDTYNMGKWLFYCGLITIGNAGCSIIQRYQQMAFDYQHKNMFMFFSLSFATIFCLLFSLRENKSNWKITIKRSWLFPAISGSSSALSNVFILLLVKRNMSPVILYPGIAVGGLIITTIFAILFFRERLRPQQWLGLCVGTVALILLNL